MKEIVDEIEKLALEHLSSEELKIAAIASRRLLWTRDKLIGRSILNRFATMLDLIEGVVAAYSKCLEEDMKRIEEVLKDVSGK